MKHYPTNQKPKRVVKLELSGQNLEKWDELQGKFVKLIEGIIDQLTENSNTKETAGAIASLASEYLKARVLKPTLENEKLISEIKLNYIKAKRECAELDNVKAETISKQLDNFEKVLKLQRLLIGSEVIFFKAKNEHGIIIKEIDDTKIDET